jgi:conjugal transfer mating pair stabilization protein TraG
VFTVFRFSGNVFTSFTSGSLGSRARARPLQRRWARPKAASALEAQASAMGTRSRAAAASSFGDFGERSTFGANRTYGEAGPSWASARAPGGTAFALGGIEGSRQLGSLARAGWPRSCRSGSRARAGQRRHHGDPSVRREGCAEGLGTSYFGQGEAGEKAFAAFSQNLVQWRAFGDRAAGMMMQARRGI